jgi:hypothetical protein
VELNKHHSKLEEQGDVQVKGWDFGESSESDLFEEVVSFGDYSLGDENDQTVRRLILDAGPNFPSFQFLTNLKNYAYSSLFG